MNSDQNLARSGRWARNILEEDDLRTFEHMDVAKHCPALPQPRILSDDKVMTRTERASDNDRHPRRPSVR